MSDPGPRTRLNELLRLLSHRDTRTALYFALVAGLLACAVSLFIPRSYKAEAKLLPNLGGTGTSSLLQLASSAGLGDILSGEFGSRENTVLTYPEILLSETVLQRTLLSPYPPSLESRAPDVLDALRVRGKGTRQQVDNGIRQMRQIVDVRANPRSTLITVSAVTQDSVLSAYIVQQMLSELNRFNLESRSSRSRATREFIQARLAEARQEMAAAEQSLVSFRQANLRIGNSPQLQLEQMRLEREATVRGELYQLLSRQYEMARIEEKRDTPTFSVIDEARPPVRKHTPKILLNGLIAAIAGAGLCILLGFLQRPIAEGYRPEMEQTTSS